MEQGLYPYPPDDVTVGPFRSWLMSQLTLPNIALVISIVAGAAIAHNRLANVEAAVLEMKQDIPKTYERKDNLDVRFKAWDAKASDLLRAIERLQDRMDRQ